MAMKRRFSALQKIEQDMYNFSCAGYVDGPDAMEFQEALVGRKTLTQAVEKVWATHASAQAIMHYFPGLSALLASSSKIQFALEAYAGLKIPESANLESGLRQQFLSVADITLDPLRPSIDIDLNVRTEPHIAERTHQVVGLLRQVLQIEVCPCTL